MQSRQHWGIELLGLEVCETAHRGDDDLLSAGLGLAGLQRPLPRPTSIAECTPALLRRRAIHSNWNGIADLRDRDGAIGAALAKPVPGREFHAALRLPGRRQGHRVMLQLPDDFDLERPCLIVTASSGSRGVYGAIALAGAFGLPRGHAVVYTDKACGSDWFDVDTGEAPDLAGLPTADPARRLFVPPELRLPAHSVLTRHAHSQENPEADWGAHLRQAAGFALAVLSREFAGRGPFTPDNTRVVAAGLSNGGGAVLQAAADGEPWLRGAVAIAANVLPRRGGRAFYDYCSEAALWMRCAQAAPALRGAPSPMPQAALDAMADTELAGLGQANHLPRALRHGGAVAAYRLLRRRGWSAAMLAAARISAAFDLWHAGSITYASALGRFAADQHPAGFRFAPVDAQGRPQPASAVDRALWWSDSSGIVPGAGVGLVGDRSRADALIALRRLWSRRDADGQRLRAGVAETRVGPPRAGLPLLLVHGAMDGLIPAEFSSLSYLRQALAAGRAVSYWHVPRAAHFDAFLGFPGYGERFRPLLPVAWQALAALLQNLDGAPLPEYRDRFAD